MWQCTIPTTNHLYNRFYHSWEPHRTAFVVYHHHPHCCPWLTVVKGGSSCAATGFGVVSVWCGSKSIKRCLLRYMIIIIIIICDALPCLSHHSKEPLLYTYCSYSSSFLMNDSTHPFYSCYRIVNLNCLLWRQLFKGYVHYSWCCCCSFCDSSKNGTDNHGTSAMVLNWNCWDSIVRNRGIES